MSDAPSDPASGISGKYVIVLLLVLGLAGAAGAGWYFMQSERQARDWLMPANAELVLKGERVTLMRLSESNPGDRQRLSETLLVDTLAMAVVRRVDISDAEALPSIRRLLLKDASYDWSGAPDNCQPCWPFALRFTDENLDRSTTILLDFDCRLARIHPFGATGVSIAPVADGLQRFFDEQMPLVKDPAAGE